MRAEYCGPLGNSALRPVQIAGEIKSGDALEIDLLDRVVREVDLAMNDGVQRCLSRHGPQAKSNLHDLPYTLRTRIPRVGRLRRRE